MTASQLSGNGEEWEDEGDDLEGGCFAAVGPAAAVSGVEEETVWPSEAGAEDDPAIVSETDGGGAAVATTAMWDTATTDTSEASSRRVGMEDERGEGRASGAGWEDLCWL